MVVKDDGDGNHLGLAGGAEKGVDLKDSAQEGGPGLSRGGGGFLEGVDEGLSSHGEATQGQPGFERLEGDLTASRSRDRRPQVRPGPQSPVVAAFGYAHHSE